MTEPKWTPGPWRVQEIIPGRATILQDTSPAHALIVAACTTLGEAAANNARLIAAAPELYAAVEAQHKAINYLLALCAANIKGFMPTENDQAWPAVVQGRAALTKARGETT